MTFFASLDLKLDTRIEKEMLEKFLAMVPDGVGITARSRFIAKDRPYEADKTEVSLHAEWGMQ